MAKSLSCRDVGVDCDFQATADTQEDLMQQVTEHARSAHGFESLPPELADKVQAAVRES